MESGPRNSESSADCKEQKIAVRMRILAVVVEVRVNRVAVAVAVAVDVTANAGELEEEGIQAGAEIDMMVVLRVGRRIAMIAVDMTGGRESFVGTRMLELVVESRSESCRGRMSALCWSRRKCCRRSPKLADTELSRAGSKEN